MGIKKRIAELTEVVGEQTAAITETVETQRRLIDVMLEKMGTQGIADAKALKVEFTDGTSKTFIGDGAPELQDQIDPSRVREVVPVQTAKAGGTVNA
jgi:hypothetical protein